MCVVWIYRDGEVRRVSEGSEHIWNFRRRKETKSTYRLWWWELFTTARDIKLKAGKNDKREGRRWQGCLFLCNSTGNLSLKLTEMENNRLYSIYIC